MSLEVVKKFAEESGSEELLSAVKGIETSQKANLDRISYLEKEFQGAIDKRNNQASLVKSKLGLEEISDEALSSFVENAGKQGSSEFEAEKRKLEDMVAMLQTEKEGLGERLTNTINMHKIERGLNDLGASKEINGARAYDILLSEATQGASFEDGELIFKANDGTTLRNADGTPMSLADRYAQIKDSEELGFLFIEKKPKSGSGATGSTAGGQKITSLEGLSEAQRVALYKNDPDLFKKLSKG